tara:strand:- start:17 stop:292 length:276 start_codon:yes stop_codon:yes gene_type:complete
MDQIIIFISGGLAVWMSQDRQIKYQRYACIVGLIGQPFWLYATFNNDQWGMFGLSIFYTIAWLKGVNTYWLKIQFGRGEEIIGKKVDLNER